MDKHLLQEAFSITKKLSGLDPSRPNQLRQIATDPKNYRVYVEGLSEGLDDESKVAFTTLAENTRVNLLENSMFSLNPYETMTLPVLRKFYPKLIAKELVNVMPIDKPEVIKGFMKARFGTYSDASAGNYPYEFPYVAPGTRITANNGIGTALVDISRGPSLGINIEAATGGTGGETESYTVDILAALGLTSSEAHIEKDFKIVGVSQDTTAGYVRLTSPVYADVDGNFSFDVTFNDGTVDEINDTVVGRINFKTGVLDWRSVGGDVDSLQYSAVASLEENRINPKVQYSIEKIRFQVVLRQISAEWSIPFEQDVKALYDINVQSELVNIIGEQIAAEIDREIIDGLIQGCYASNDLTKHVATFDKNPPATYTWGRKQWYENILPPLTELSAQVYNSTLMQAANTLACNPLDAALFENLNDFNYDGGSVDGGDLGYRTAKVQGGKWKLLVSSIVPEGKIVLKYRSNEMQRASFVYAPYVPAILTPFPIGPLPSLTVMTRYASKMVRPEAVAILNVTDTSV
jgi:hypothetical protein